MKYICYFFIFATPFSLLISCELAVIAHKTISQYDPKIMSLKKTMVHVDTIEDYEIITCHPGTLFDNDGFVYEYSFFNIERTQVNIRKGFTGIAVEKYATIQGIRFYKTIAPLTIIQKKSLRKMLSKL